MADSSTVDPELLVDAVLLHVADLGEGGESWLKTEFTRVLSAVMAGDEYVTSTSFQGQSSAAERKVSAKELLAILTTCRQRLPDEDGQIDNVAAAAMLIPRFTNFPL